MNGGQPRQTLGVGYDLLFRANGMPTAGAIPFLLDRAAEFQVLIFPTTRLEGDGAGREAAVLQARVYLAIERWFRDWEHPDERGSTVAAMEHIDFFLEPQICDIRIDSGAGLLLHTPEADWPTVEKIRAAMKAAGLAAVAILVSMAANACCIPLP